MEKQSQTKPARLVLDLFLAFMKIGAFTFGGGYSMIPLIQKEIVENKKWITDDDLLEIIAIAESTPGPIAINAATFIGYRVVGFWGSFFATFGVVLPSFIIILLVSFVLRQFYEIRAVRYAFFGIRAGVLALILKSIWTMFKKTPKKIISCILMAAAFLAVAVFKIHVLIVIGCCAAIGLIYALLTERRKAK